MRPTGPAALALPAAALLTILWIVVGCALVGATATPGVVVATATPAPPVPTATVVSPTVTAPSATARQTPAPPTSLATASATIDAATPPAADLSAAGTTVSGHLGTYCWAGICADEFELPQKATLPAMRVDASQSLSLALSPQTAFVQWNASYSAAKMADLVPLGDGGSPYDPDSSATQPPGLTVIDFPAPPKGDWVVVVSVHFGTVSTLVSGGDAIYSWHVTAE